MSETQGRPDNSDQLCQHGNPAVACEVCKDIQRRVDRDSAMYRKGSGGGASLVGGMEPRKEAKELIKQIEAEIHDDVGISASDDSLVASLNFKMQNVGYQPSIKEIRWLRDIRDRVTQ